MKTVGILMLFGLCAAIGMRAAAKKSERYRRVHALIRDLSVLSDEIGAGERSLPQIVQSREGELFTMLSKYLDLRKAAKREAEAAEEAVCGWTSFAREHQALLSFLSGLSAVSAAQMHQRIETLMQSLRIAEQEAEETAKQAKTIRVVGVLAGVGVCILLL